jgi:hypothetical protein
VSATTSNQTAACAHAHPNRTAQPTNAPPLPT